MTNPTQYVKWSCNSHIATYWIKAMELHIKGVMVVTRLNPIFKDNMETSVCYLQYVFRYISK